MSKHFKNSFSLHEEKVFGLSSLMVILFLHISEIHITEILQEDLIWFPRQTSLYLPLVLNLPSGMMFNGMELFSVCREGYEPTTRSGCALCKAEEYKDTIGNRPCAKCPSGSTTLGERGSTACGKTLQKTFISFVANQHLLNMIPGVVLYSQVSQCCYIPTNNTLKNLDSNLTLIAAFVSHWEQKQTR